MPASQNAFNFRCRAALFAHRAARAKRQASAFVRGETQPRPNGKPTPERKKRKEPSPAQKRCKDAVGFSLDYPNITPNAIPIFLTLSRKAMGLYVLMCGYMDTFRCQTKPRSRKAWAKLASIKGSRYWRQIEKELIDSGLLKRHKDDKVGDYNNEQEIRFVLPLAKRFRQM